MSKTHLEKILKTMLIEKYPGIDDVIITTDDDTKSQAKTNYTVHLGMKPKELNKYRFDDIRNYVKDISKYVVNPAEETIGMVNFFNSNTNEESNDKNFISNSKEYIMILSRPHYMDSRINITIAHLDTFMGNLRGETGEFSNEGIVEQITIRENEFKDFTRINKYNITKILYS